jgi:hypothetical protein
MFPTFSGISYIHIGQMPPSSLQGLYLQRPAEVFTHQVAPWHPAAATLEHPCRHLLQAINTYSAMVSGKPTKYQNRPMNPSKNEKKDGTAITFNQLKYSARLQRFPRWKLRNMEITLCF